MLKLLKFYEYEITKNPDMHSRYLPLFLKQIQAHHIDKINFKFEISEENDKTIGRIFVDDEKQLQKAMVLLPLNFSKPNSLKDNVAFDLMRGQKCNKATQMGMYDYVCGFIRKDVVEHVGDQQLQKFINEAALKYNSKIKINQELGHNTFCFGNQVFCCEDKEYLPVLLKMHPNQMGCNQVKFAAYEKEISIKFTMFNYAVRRIFQEKASKFALVSTLAGDVSFGEDHTYVRNIKKPEQIQELDTLIV